MTEPSDPHDLVARYFDGELSAEDERIALEHLARCGRCQEELGDLVGLHVALTRRPEAIAAPRTSDAALEAARAPAPVLPLRPRQAPAPRRWARAAIAVAALAAAAAAVLVLRPRPQPPAALALAPTRSAEVRFSAAPFSAHRPYQVQRGAQSVETFPLESLAELERQGRRAALVAARALGGELVSAHQSLLSQPTSPERESDLAALELLAGRPDLALEAADRALALAPGSTAAAWNRALALRALELPSSAAQVLDEVAARGEPGWAKEAADKAASLREQVTSRAAEVTALYAAGRAMIERTGPILTARDAEAHPGLARLYFHDALRSSASAQEARALAPLAEVLDRGAGNDLARRAVERVAAARFASRQPLALAYRELVLGRAPDRGRDLLVRLAQAGAEVDDLRLGAIVFSGAMYERLAELEPLVKATDDPWFLLLLPLYRGNLLLQQGATDRAETVLREGLVGCDGQRWAHRCAALAEGLRALYGTQGRYADLEQQAAATVRLYRQAGHYQAEDNALAALGEAMRMRGRESLAAAILTEAKARMEPTYCAGARFAASGLAMLSIYRAGTIGEPALAPTQCDQPPTSAELAMLVDLARTSGSEADRDRAARWIQAAREHGGPELAQVATLAELRLAVERDSAAAPRLRDALANLTGDDEVTAGLRAWVYQTLVDEAARRADWSAALHLMAEELRLPSVGPCTLGSSLDVTRKTAVVLDASGQAIGSRTLLDRPERWRDAEPAPPELVFALAGCAHIRVIARPPLHGRAAVLPAELPWSFVGQRRDTPRPVATSGARTEVFIGDALPPAALGLPALAPLRAPTAALALRGPQATPARALAELGTATYAEFHVHGEVDLKTSEESFLALSPGADERWALTAAEVRRAKLAAAPVVVLAACRAARVAPYEHRRWSLPDAFLEAGASAVIAPTVEIPDAEAAELFAELRQRLASGEPTAAALAAVRKAHVARGRAWAAEVILFE